MEWVDGRLIIMGTAPAVVCASAYVRPDMGAVVSSTSPPALHRRSSGPVLHRWVGFGDAIIVEQRVSTSSMSTIWFTSTSPPSWECVPTITGLVRAGYGASGWQRHREDHFHDPCVSAVRLFCAVGERQLARVDCLTDILRHAPQEISDPHSGDRTKVVAIARGRSQGLQRRVRSSRRPGGVLGGYYEWILCSCCSPAYPSWWQWNPEREGT